MLRTRRTLSGRLALPKGIAALAEIAAGAFAQSLLAIIQGRWIS
jgi:hypothetical protein